MRNMLLILIALLVAGDINAQLKPFSKLATTNTLPEGTIWKDGKITLKTGYRATVAESDKSIIVIQKTNRMASGTSGGNNITGSFTCLCSEDNSAGDCFIKTSGTDFSCGGSKCKCYLAVTINPKSGLAITRQTEGEIWKRFINPSKSQ